MGSLRLPIGLNRSTLQGIVDSALAEDVAWGDVTTDSLIDGEQSADAHLVARELGILAGIEVACLVFSTVDPSLQVVIHAPDAAHLSPGLAVATVSGPVAAMLKAERVALNLLQRLSGIATLTAKYVAAVVGTGARIVDTRKTTPGLRALEKYAVRVGGGFNHRFCLADGVLIKDNHICALRASGRTLREGIALVRQHAPHTLKIEVEVETLGEVEEALEAGADAVLLDNMSVDALRRSIALIGGRAIAEASGGISLQTVRAVAETGVDLISVGALTHSARSLDVGLDIETVTPRPRAIA